ncbi:hypothetical protein [Pseudoruegeria sp. HB172150]|uniref:hypothetical protein n=1 Tax=Pseudoruegeria sp. HB172150 TaxID=2721164 RepID=UPI001554949E|nr:hypothetical protein [Pseudoruegeria sp. HB172150]
MSKLRFPRPAALAALAALALFPLASASAQAQAWIARHGMTSAQYQSAFNQFTGQGYRLTDVSGYRVNGTDFYAAIWSKKGGPAWAARHGMSGGSYQSNFNDLTAKGFAPETVSGYGGKFAAIWAKSGGAFVARHGLTSAQYQAEFDSWVAKGYRLTDVTGYEAAGQVRYAAIWRKQGGSAWQARHGMTSAQYQATFNQMSAMGFKPLRVNGYDVNGTPYYAAIWTMSPGGYVARHGLTGAQYQAEFDKWTSQGYRLQDISGYTAGGQARYAAIWYR